MTHAYPASGSPRGHVPRFNLRSINHERAALVSEPTNSENTYPNMDSLRLEDIDTTRSRAEYEQGIYDDLRWLGLTSGLALNEVAARVLADSE